MLGERKKGCRFVVKLEQGSDGERMKEMCGIEREIGQRAAERQRAESDGES